MKLTNLSERTIRRYIKDDKIKGSKVGGVWRFSEEQIEEFYDYKEVIRSAQKEISRDVLDFINMPNPSKLKGHTCLMIDIDDEVNNIDEIKQKIMDLCNMQNQFMKMKFYRDKKNYRIVLIGRIGFISEVAQNINLLLQD
jgi:excisionase family DNA binding protein